MTETPLTVLELELKQKYIKSNIKNITERFDELCNQFMEHHLSHILGMEPNVRVKYILANFALYEPSLYEDDDGIYTIYCESEKQVEKLTNYCVRCFPGYKVTYEVNETRSIYIEKILSKEELLNIEIKQKLERLQQDIKYKSDELSRLQNEEMKLIMSLKV